MKAEEAARSADARRRATEERLHDIESEFSDVKETLASEKAMSEKKVVALKMHIFRNAD